jgi:hypothetical protein
MYEGQKIYLSHVHSIHLHIDLFLGSLELILALLDFKAENSIAAVCQKSIKETLLWNDRVSLDFIVEM